MNESGLIDYLQQQGISFQRVDHPPVFTCDEAARLRPELGGLSTKNLFLRDEKSTRFFLLMTDCARRIDMRALGKQVNAKKLHLGSEETLSELLGLTRGAVTVLGLVNDTDRRVELLVDTQIWQSDSFLCHPLVNTATLRLSRSDLTRFFDLTGHSPQYVDCG